MYTSKCTVGLVTFAIQKYIFGKLTKILRGKKKVEKKNYPYKYCSVIKKQSLKTRIHYKCLNLKLSPTIVQVSHLLISPDITRPVGGYVSFGQP